jgi:predicted DNA-binding protein
LADRQRKELTKQLVVRIDDELYEALEDDAERNGRTVAQTVRFWLNQGKDDRLQLVG